MKKKVNFNCLEGALFTIFERNFYVCHYIVQFRNYQKLKPQNPSFIKPHHVSPLGFMFSCCSPGLMREHGVITKIGGAMLYQNEANLFLKSHFFFLRLLPRYRPKPQSSIEHKYVF